MMVRRRKSKADKEASGTDQPCRRKADPIPETAPVSDRAAEPMPGMTPAGMDIWKSMAESLVASGRLTDIDRMSFMMLCETMAEFNRVNSLIHKSNLPPIALNNVGNTHEHPMFVIRRNIAKELIAYFKEFGLTPRSRNFAQLENAETEQKGKENKFSEFA